MGTMSIHSCAEQSAREAHDSRGNDLRTGVRALGFFLAFPTSSDGYCSC